MDMHYKQSITKEYAVTRTKHVPFVIIPLEKWNIIEDILGELAAPALKKSIISGRNANRKGKAISYSYLRNSFDLP